MIGLLLMGLASLQVDADAALRSLKARTDELSRAIEEGAEPRDGLMIGAFRLSVERDSMTDAQEISAETRLTTGPAGGTMSLVCEDGHQQIVYHANRVIVDDRVLRWAIRVDDNPALSGSGFRTADLKGVFVDPEFLRLGQTRDQRVTLERDILGQMVLGQQVRIRVMPEVGEPVEHSFSLSGFTRASIMADC